MHSRRSMATLLALLLGIPLVLASCGGQATASSSAIKHIFYIMMENHATN